VIPLVPVIHQNHALAGDINRDIAGVAAADDVQVVGNTIDGQLRRGRWLLLAVRGIQRVGNPGAEDG
jgi:hypothetical protein